MPIMNNSVTHISNPKITKIVLNNFDRFFYLLILIGFLMTYNDFEDWQMRIVAEITVGMIVLLFLISRLLKRAIHAINIFWDDKNAEIFFYKTKNPKMVDFEKIQSIIVNGAIYLKINDKTKAFSTNKYLSVLPELNRIRKIQWGKYCDILGPNKEIRDKINKKLSTSI